MSFAHLANYSSQAELDAARAATQDKYRKIFSRQIEEGRRQGQSPLESMDFSIWHSRVATPEENQEYKWAFTPLGTKVKPWRKWTGGNKMGSAGASINAARRAKAAARRNAPDANVNNYTNKNLADRLGLTALSNFVDSRVNDVQGKFMPSNPSFVGVGANPSFQSIGTQVGNMLGSFASDGSNNVQSSFVPSQTDIGEINRSFAPDVNVNPYTNKRFTDRIGLTPITNFLNSRFADVQGKFMPSNPSFVGVGANPSYGVPSIGSFNDVSSFSNFTGGLPSLDAGSVMGAPSLTNLSSFDPGSFLGDMSMGSLIAGDPNRGLNRRTQYGRGGAPDDIKSITTDSDFGKRMREAVLGMPIQAFVPRMAGIFAV